MSNSRESRQSQRPKLKLKHASNCRSGGSLAFAKIDSYRQNGPICAAAATDSVSEISYLSK